MAWNDLVTYNHRSRPAPWPNKGAIGDFRINTTMCTRDVRPPLPRVTCGDEAMSPAAVRCVVLVIVVRRE